MRGELHNQLATLISVFSVFPNLASLKVMPFMAGALFVYAENHYFTVGLWCTESRLTFTYAFSGSIPAAGHCFAFYSTHI